MKDNTHVKYNSNWQFLINVKNFPIEILRSNNYFEYFNIKLWTINYHIIESYNTLYSTRSTVSKKDLYLSCGAKQKQKSRRSKNTIKSLFKFRKVNRNTLKHALEEVTLRECEIGDRPKGSERYETSWRVPDTVAVEILGSWTY